MNPELERSSASALVGCIAASLLGCTSVQGAPGDVEVIPVVDRQAVRGCLRLQPSPERSGGYDAQAVEEDPQGALAAARAAAARGRIDLLVLDAQVGYLFYVCPDPTPPAGTASRGASR